MFINSDNFHLHSHVLPLDISVVSDVHTVLTCVLGGSLIPLLPGQFYTSRSVSSEGFRTQWYPGPGTLSQSYIIRTKYFGCVMLQTFI